MDLYLLSIILICLFFSALFSGIEIAFVTTNKLHIELQGKQGSISGRIILRFANKPSQFIATTLIGNNLALVIYGIFMALFLEPIIRGYLPYNFENDALVLFIQTVISTLVVLFTAEYIPKSIFLINPYFLLSVFSIPFLIIYYILSPAVYFIAWSTKIFITKILQLEYSENKPIFGLTDLNNYIKNIISSQEPNEEREIDTKIFNNALEFKTVKVRECMIPRTEIVAVDINDHINEIKSAFIESGHTKILVYEESIDNVIGYCHAMEMFNNPHDIKSILKEIVIVPETMAANELLIQLITNHKSLALVVDEFGGTSGIVSIEDIIEEIFGEIKDEHDEEDLIEEEINQSTFVLSGRLEIDQLIDKYGWNLPEGEYDTIGGLVLSVNENLPEVGQIIEIPGYEIEILYMNETRIEELKLSIINPSKES